MVSALAALGSALLVAIASVLQHRAGLGPAATLRSVLRHPLWLVGALAGVVGFLLHAAALAGGSLSMVQPLLVSGLLFALPLSWALERRAIHLLDLGAAVAVVGGLIIFQLTAHAARGRSTADLALLGWCVVVALAIVGVGLLAAVRQARYRASWLGFCAGAAFGLLAALLKSSVGTITVHGLRVLSTWPLYAFVVLVVGAIVVNQLAFNAGPLAASLPLVTIIDPVVSVAVGSIAFGEKTASAPLPVMGQVLGFALMSVGVVVLSRRASNAELSTPQRDDAVYVAATRSRG
jgi:drug/metabolite transporter (DMT)-like permease